MERPRTNHGKAIWTEQGKAMNRSWKCHEQVMETSGTEPGKFMARSWKDPARTMDRTGKGHRRNMKSHVQITERPWKDYGNVRIERQTEMNIMADGLRRTLLLISHLH